MTGEEMKNFYKEDERLYDLKENKKFLIMFNHLIDEGYSLFIGIDEMQDLIDRLFTWYEIKYPEREFDFYDGKLTSDFVTKKELSDLMNINQLFFRLSDNQIKLLEGNYRTISMKEYPIYEEGKKIGVSKKVYFKINRNENDIYYNKHKDFIISADAVSGKVDTDYETDKYITGNVTIDDIYRKFKEEYTDRLEFEVLEKAINNKYIDNYLRDSILELVALKLIYSKKTTPERGYIRAKRFIDEFNSRLGLNLTYEEINRVMNKDYSEDKSKVKVISL